MFLVIKVILLLYVDTGKIYHIEGVIDDNGKPCPVDLEKKKEREASRKEKEKIKNKQDANNGGLKWNDPSFFV